MQRIEDILQYWFGAQPDDPDAISHQVQLWFTANADTDRYVREHFEADLKAARTGALAKWEHSPRGRLALIVLLDQFPRNIYRGTPEAFAFDTQALRWCVEGQVCGHDRQLRPIEQSVFYLPMQHAEDLAIQERSVRCMERLVHAVPTTMLELFDQFLDFAVRHRDIIARFGRFPHRNEILGRVSTPEEIAFLEQLGSSF
jgi:uncharacterized protein (DUF924 family)